MLKCFVCMRPPKDAPIEEDGHVLCDTVCQRAYHRWKVKYHPGDARVPLDP